MKMNLWGLKILVFLPWSAMASLKDLLEGCLEQAVRHLVAVAVRLGQVHLPGLSLTFNPHAIYTKKIDRLTNGEIYITV